MRDFAQEAKDCDRPHPAPGWSIMHRASSDDETPECGASGEHNVTRDWSEVTCSDCMAGFEWLRGPY